MHKSFYLAIYSEKVISKSANQIHKKLKAELKENFNVETVKKMVEKESEKTDEFILKNFCQTILCKFYPVSLEKNMEMKGESLNESQVNLGKRNKQGDPNFGLSQSWDSSGLGAQPNFNESMKDSGNLDSRIKGTRKQTRQSIPKESDSVSTFERTRYALEPQAKAQEPPTKAQILQSGSPLTFGLNFPGDLASPSFPKKSNRNNKTTQRNPNSSWLDSFPLEDEGFLQFQADYKSKTLKFLREFEGCFDEGKLVWWVCRPSTRFLDFPFTQMAKNKEPFLMKQREKLFEKMNQKKK